MAKFGLLSLIIFSLAGCLATGKNFPSDVSWIKQSKTKQKDVELILGKPYAVGQSGQMKTWTYVFYKYRFPAKAYHKELKFYWDKGAVKHFSFNSSFPLDISLRQPPSQLNLSKKVR